MRVISEPTVHGYGFVLVKRDSRDSNCPSTGHCVPPRDFCKT